jgi:hypothetical protein
LQNNRLRVHVLCLARGLLCYRALMGNRVRLFMPFVGYLMPFVGN